MKYFPATVALAVVLASGCANWQLPEPPAADYFCKPDSAVRYRGKAPKGVSIRPAPAHGSCRHQ